MATGIPLPGDMSEALRRGVDTGSSMFSRLMQPVLERERQKQQAEQFAQANALKEKHFAQEMALRRQAAARAGANSDIQRQILQQNLLRLQHSNDPMYELNQYKALENWLKGQSGGAQQSEPTMPAPTQEMEEGMGMFSPQGLEDIQSETSQIPEKSPNTGGMDLELLKAHPMLRGWAKKHLGFDPLQASPQTPEDKQAAALDLFKEKEKIKAASKGGETPTNSVLTQNQQAIQGIDTVLPMLTDLIENPSKVYGRWDFSPSKKAAYNAKTSGMIDTLVAAQSLPKVQASIDLVEQQIRRGTGESEEAYIERIKDLKKDLMLRRSKAQSVIKNRKVNTATSEDLSSLSDEELQRIAAGGE